MRKGKRKKKKNIITSQFNPDWCLSYFKGHKVVNSWILKHLYEHVQGLHC